MMFFITMSWILSIIFIFLNHPLSFGFILVMQTIIVSLLTGILNFDFWFSYILFLIMIGGMLVLFIYMTSIASNEKFKFSKMMMFLMSLLLPLTMILSTMNPLFTPMILSNNSDLLSQEIYNINLSVNKFFNPPNMLMMIMMIMYLLLTLIAVVQITQMKMGPLRPYLS